MSDMNDEQEQGQEPTPTPTPEGVAAEAAAAAVKSPYLTAAKMLPVEGVVYCLDHAAVHEDTTDPYGSGDDECDVKEHRTVYYRGRKGDIDETLEASGEARGESRRADVAPEGSVVVNSLSAVQARLTRKVIAATSADELTDQERSLVGQLVGRERERAEAAFAELYEIIGVQRLGAAEESLELLASAQRKLGAGDV